MNHSHTDYFSSIFQCPLCDSVPMDERDDFLRDVRYSIKRYGKGDMLVAQGSVYEMLYIVIKGEVVTEMSDEKGEFVKIESIKAPNPLATGFLFATDNSSPVTALAKTDCVAILIPKENVFLLMSKYQDFMKAFLAYISNKVAFLSEKLRLASLRSIRAKLGYYVLKESGYKEMKAMGGNACWDCHRDVPHTRSRSEVSTPNSHVPMPDTNVPDWLSTAMKNNQIK